MSERRRSGIVLCESNPLESGQINLKENSHVNKIEYLGSCVLITSEQLTSLIDMLEPLE